MRRRIPAYVISALVDVISTSQTHDSMDILFEYAGAPLPPLGGSKRVKAKAWLNAVNSDSTLDSLQILGRLVEEYMEPHIGSDHPAPETALAWKEDIGKALERAKLHYVEGGRLVATTSPASESLEQIIRERDYPSIEQEFERAVLRVEEEPREAVSAACNVLESVCKIIIDDQGLGRPRKQDLGGVWSVVRKHLGFDPSQVEDQDLQQILSGMISTVTGIAALRTHASSAHGQGPLEVPPFS